MYQSYPNYVFQLRTSNLKHQNTAEYILPHKQYAKTSNKPKKDIRHTHTHTAQVQHILMLDHKTHTGCVLVNQSTKVLMPQWWCKSLLLRDTLKQTIHETTFVAGDRATRSSVHKKMCATFYKLLANTPPVYFKATCRM